jgi:hypothetical protein
VRRYLFWIIVFSCCVSSCIDADHHYALGEVQTRIKKIKRSLPEVCRPLYGLGEPWRKCMGVEYK